MRSFTSAAAVIICVGLAGCASTKVETTGTSMTSPLCRPSEGRITVVSFWEPKWRPDQKEPGSREVAAVRGIEDFFASTGCVRNFEIRRLPERHATEHLPNEELVKLASTTVPSVDRVTVITVRELGPKLLIGIPVIVEGSTEAVLEIQVLDAHTSLPLADLRTHWQNGGTLVIKGVKTLPSDMKSALQAVLMPEARE